MAANMVKQVGMVQQAGFVIPASWAARWQLTKAKVVSRHENLNNRIDHPSGHHPAKEVVAENLTTRPPLLPRICAIPVASCAEWISVICGAKPFFAKTMRRIYRGIHEYGVSRDQEASEGSEQLVCLLLDGTSHNS